ncbi:MAG: SEC-C metal-binding domain-containing protein [Pseudomonadota bacterium]
MNVYALCYNCKGIFSSPHIIGGSGSIMMAGNTLGPCPSCGGTGGIFNGVYDCAKNTIDLLTSPSINEHHLERLRKILVDTRSKELPIEAVELEIDTQVPELRSLKDVLPRTRNELYAFAGLVLGILVAIGGGASKLIESETSLTEAEVSQIVEQALARGPKPAMPLTGKKTNKVGRNQPCPCGSGEKYKKCCRLRK